MFSTVQIKRKPSRERVRALQSLMYPHWMKFRQNVCACVCARTVIHTHTGVLVCLLVGVHVCEHKVCVLVSGENCLTTRIDGCCYWCMVYPDFRLTDAFAYVCVWYLLSLSLLPPRLSSSSRCIIKCLGNKCCEVKWTDCNIFQQQ